MAYEIVPKYNWVVFHPLSTANNQGFSHCSIWHYRLPPKKNAPPPCAVLPVLERDAAFVAAVPISASRRGGERCGCNKMGPGKTSSK